MVTLKSGRRLRGDSEVNVGASTSTAATRNDSDKPPSKRLESSTDTDSSLPDIPPSASMTTSMTSVRSLIIDIRDEADLTKAEEEDEEEEDEEEEPDYERSWKRAKKDPQSDSILPSPTPPSRTCSPADTVLYDLTEEADAVDTDSDVEEVTFVKVTQNVSKPLIVIDDDDDDDDVGDRRGEKRDRRASSVKKIERQFSGVASEKDAEQKSQPSPTTPRISPTPPSPPRISPTPTPPPRPSPTPPPPQTEGETSATTAADALVPFEADDAIVSDAIEIVINDGLEDSTHSPPRKRQPVTASVEEIVPEKYRTLYFNFFSASIEDDSLWTLFAQFGEIESLGVDVVSARVREREGRVVFKKFYAVDGCVKAKPLSIGITNVHVRRTPEKAEENQHVDKIYVSGIYHLGSNDLDRYFSTFGSIKEVAVVSARGFAFVVFNDSDSVDKTLLQHFHLIDGLLLEVKRAFIKKPNQRPRPPPNPFAPPPPPKFDKGPRSRAPALAALAAASITPFPRHVEMKPKLDLEAPVPFDRCESATSGSVVSNRFPIKTEPVLKTEKG